MHRYFARRPYSLFERLVEHYSDVGDVILDPFCGGGVTLVEGVSAGRRCVGFDTNPLATFVTRMELKSADVVDLSGAFVDFCVSFEKINSRLFKTECRSCTKSAQTTWYEYSALASCPSCGHTFRISAAKKTGLGAWSCLSCGKRVRFSPTSLTKHELVSLHYSCGHCGDDRVAPAEPLDVELGESVDRELSSIKDPLFWIPDAAIPDCNMQRESALFKNGIITFDSSLHHRHLLALGILKEMIIQANRSHRAWLLLTFSSTLRYTNGW